MKDIKFCLSCTLSEKVAGSKNIAILGVVPGFKVLKIALKHVDATGNKLSYKSYLELSA